MKKSEIVFVSLFILGIFFKFMYWPGANILMVLAAAGEVFLHTFLGFAVLNGLPVKGIFKRVTYANTSILSMVYATFAGITVSLCILSIMFRMLDWPGSYIIFQSAVIPSLLIIPVSVIRFLSAHSGLHKVVLIRVLIVLILALIFWILPNHLFDFNHAIKPVFMPYLQEKLWKM